MSEAVVKDSGATVFVRITLAAAVGIALAVAIMLFPGSANGQTTLCAGGDGAGQCKDPRALGVNLSSGDLFVRDVGNVRVNRFSGAGVFQLAFGWGVRDGSTAALQACGPAATPPIGSCFPGLPGAGTGQIGETDRAMAVDASGDVYVPSGITARMQKFDDEGNFERMWGWDVVATGPNDDVTIPFDEFEVCVPSEGDVCKAGVPGNGAGQFERAVTPAVGPDGTIYTSSGEHGALVQRFSADGDLLEGGILLEGGPGLNGSGGVSSMSIASDGSLYVVGAGGLSGGLFKYAGSGGSPMARVDAAFGHVNPTIARDASGALYAVQLDGVFTVITEYDISGAVPVAVRRYGYGQLPRLGSGSVVTGIGMAPSGGGAYLAVSGNGNRVESFPSPPPGPVVAFGDPVATAVGSVRATLRARINPEGAPTTYRIQYVDQKSFDDEGGFASPKVRETASIPVGSTDFSIHDVQVTIGCANPITEAGEEGKCLTPETQYRFRVIAEHANGDQGIGPVEGESFTTSGTIEFGETWSTDVGTGSTRLHGEVDPSGIPAIGWFEYVEESVCEEDEENGGPEDCFDRAMLIPDIMKGASPLDFGAGEEMKEASVFVNKLKPGATYRYRLLAQNPLIEPLESASHTFRTFATPVNVADRCANAMFRVGTTLPDCRAYEMVSPLDKGGGDVVAMFSFTNFLAEYTQSADTGDKLTYSSVRSMGDAESAPLTSQYIATRDQGREEWISHGISPPRDLNVLGEGLTLDAEYKLFSDDLCTAWLRHDSDPLTADAITGYANLYKRDNCDENADTYEAVTTVKPPLGKTEPRDMDFELQGVSGDGAHAIYKVKAALTDPATSDIFNVYDSLGSVQRLVCVLPGGAAVGSGCSAGSKAGILDNGRLDAVAHAVSEDGSRVFWSSGSQLYMRENGHSASSGAECANPARACTVAIGTGQYWNAAADGSAALYITPTGELRVFDVATRTSAPVAGEVEGVLGASEDLSRVYLLSREALEDGAQDGAPNLYLHEGPAGAGDLTFVATLAEGDTVQGKTPSPVQTQPVLHTARTTPSGGHLAFMSLASLTGSDNRDAKHGSPAAQVYRYEAASGKLDCASCNPTGGRPVSYRIGYPPVSENGSIWAAGEIATAQNQLYKERVISEDGTRIFFESKDALVLADTNGAQDVYQWETVGAGDCTLDSPSYNHKAGGCVALISSGRDSADAEFVDASADGSDVFFATTASLVGQDTELIDIYDARVGGGFPPPPIKAQECEGETCQSPPPPPPDVTPSSETFRGHGNVKHAVKKPKPHCAKTKVRKKGKCVAKKAKKRAKGAKKRGRRAGANRGAGR